MEIGKLFVIEQDWSPETSTSCLALQVRLLHTTSWFLKIKYHKIQEAIRARSLSLECCPTEMVAEILTKPLPRPAFEKCHTGGIIVLDTA